MWLLGLLCAVTSNEQGLAVNRIMMFNSSNILFVQITLLSTLFNVNLTLVTLHFKYISVLPSQDLHSKI